MFDFSAKYAISYLCLRFWVGMWIAALLFIMVVFDLSALVRFITRFTEEGFATLIAVIFIYEAIKKLVALETMRPLNLNPDVIVNYTCSCEPTAKAYNLTNRSVKYQQNFYNAENISARCDYFNEYARCEKDFKRTGLCMPKGDGCGLVEPVPDAFLFGCLLFIGTFALSVILKNFRNSTFFPTKVRVLISDFAVFTSIITMVLVDWGVGLNTPKLEVPAQFRPTRSDARGFVVNPFINPWWTYLAAPIPSLLGTILIFLDQQITAVIVNRRENLLKKGKGYHLDLFIIACLVVINAVLGLPWFVAATVLSINHVNSLRIESESAAPGEKPRFLGVREQRVTGLVVFILIGLSVFMTALLRLVPMAVLYGVFLYMGISALKGIQFFDRMLLFFMPMKWQPDYHFLRVVPIMRVHLFTAIQAACFVVLWIIKSIKDISIAFPLLVLAMVFVRFALNRVFSRTELAALDDIMPEAHRRQKADDKKKELEKEQETSRVIDPPEPHELTGSIQVVKSGKVHSIPVKVITNQPAQPDRRRSRVRSIDLGTGHLDIPQVVVQGGEPSKQ